MKQIFESENICFVEVSELLVKEYLAMVNDIENVARLIGRGADQISEEKERRWVCGKLEEKARVFSMLEKESGAFIGNVELEDVGDGSGMLGIAVTADMQDRGFGTEAVRAVTAYWMDQLPLDRIWLRAYPHNTRAIHVYEKCGFRIFRKTDEDVFMELCR